MGEITGYYNINNCIYIFFSKNPNCHKKAASQRKSETLCGKVRYHKKSTFLIYAYQKTIVKPPKLYLSGLPMLSCRYIPKEVLLVALPSSRSTIPSRSSLPTTWWYPKESSGSGFWWWWWLNLRVWYSLIGLGSYLGLKVEVMLGLDRRDMEVVLILMVVAR